MALLAADQVPGIPRDPDTLADILLECGLAVPRMEEGQPRRYWRLAPAPLARDGQTITLAMLRLAAPDLVLAGVPPAPVATVTRDVEADAQAPTGSAVVAAPVAPQPSAAVDSAPPILSQRLRQPAGRTSVENRVSWRGMRRTDRHRPTHSQAVCRGKCIQRRAGAKRAHSRPPPGCASRERAVLSCLPWPSGW